MSDLKPCPCGKTPTEIGVYESTSTSKWMWASPNCCGEWNIEFRTHYKQGDELNALAVEAWNDATRAAPDQKLLDLLRKAKDIIEEHALTVEHEWGECGTLEDMLSERAMPEVYYDIEECLKKLGERDDQND